MQWKLLGAVAVLLGPATVAAQTPTFAKDIVPIFQEKCEACHRPNSIAPMSLVTYEEVRPWARSIRTLVESRQMPPWHIDKTVGIQDFENDLSLSDEELATILAWVGRGARRGDPADMPPPVEWPADEGWLLAEGFNQAEPDLIIKSTPWTQKVDADDTYWTPVVPTGLTEPRWVRGIEMRPATVAGRTITHHAAVRLTQDETDAVAQNSIDDNGRAIDGLFMEWVVGQPGEVMRPNTGRLLLPGAKFSFDIYYSSGQEDVTDYLELGIYLYPEGEEPKYRQVLNAMAATSAGGIDIPPNSIKATQGFFTMRENGRIESFQPHMHLRGKAMSLEALLPTGQTVMLSHVSDYDFNWQISYAYTDDAAPLLPKGTIIKVTAWHDNTAANPANPDPNVWVGYGDREVDEAAHAWVNVTYMDDESYATEVAARRERLGQATQGQ